MKKIFLMAFAVMFALTACEKTPVNGALDGMWQLMEVSEKSLAAESGWAQAKSTKGEAVHLWVLEFAFQCERQDFRGQGLIELITLFPLKV